MKVTFITAVWKRPEIFELFAKGIEQLRKLNPQIVIEVCVSGSEGLISKTMVMYKGFKYIEADNDPLGAKMNQASILSKATEADYYILVGSDDVIHNNLFQKYLLHMKKGIDYIYLTDCYFYNADSDESLYWAGYDAESNRGHALGAGRVLSKKIMKKINFKCWYDVELSNVLDTAFDRIVEPHIETRKALNCKKDNVHILDIKSEVNMTEFEVWDNSKMINNSIIKNKFRYLWN